MSGNQFGNICCIDLEMFHCICRTWQFQIISSVIRCSYSYFKGLVWMSCTMKGGSWPQLNMSRGWAAHVWALLHSVYQKTPQFGPKDGHTFDPGDLAMDFESSIWAFLCNGSTSMNSSPLWVPYIGHNWPVVPANAT